MRVSEQQRYNLVNHRVEKAKSQNADVLETLSTQKRVNRLSDDPTAVSSIVRNKNAIAEIDQYKKNISYAKGYLTSAESAVSKIYEKLIRAKELSVGMSNDTYDANSREATSREIREVINEIGELANTKFNDRYIFSGFRTNTPTLSDDGTFMGDDGGIFLPVSKQYYRQTNLQSRYLFEASPEEREKGHFNMIDSLDALLKGLLSDDKHTIRKSMNELDFQLNKTSSFQASIGAMYRAADDAGQSLEQSYQTNKETLSRLEDADIYKASSDFRRTEAVLQSTLLASTKLLQPSLLNFLQ